MACSADAGPASPTTPLFVNDDSCGDWTWQHNGMVFQSGNAASAVAFVLAGLPLLRSSAPSVQAYGLLLCWVGVGSFSFHATSLAVSFFIDIVPMAATAALMVFRALHALQAESGRCDAAGESSRYLVSTSAAAIAVYVPWALMAFSFPHSVVWGVWAFLFGSMGAFFGVVALAVFASEGLLQGPSGRDLAVAVLCILLGLGCTLHSFLPGLCTGWRDSLPTHALWHLLSAITANRCGRLLETMTELAQSLEARERKPCGKSLLLRLVQCDALPSQFSM